MWHPDQNTHLTRGYIQDGNFKATFLLEQLNMELQWRCGGPQEISETVVKLSQKRKQEGIKDNILDISVRQFLVGMGLSR